MAEIHVERKRGIGSKVWLLLLVVLIIAALAYLWYAGYLGGTAGTGVNSMTDHFAVITAGALNGA